MAEDGISAAEAAAEADAAVKAAKKARLAARKASLFAYEIDTQEHGDDEAKADAFSDLHGHHSHPGRETSQSRRRRQTGEGSSAEHSAEPGASAPGEPKKRMTPTAEELGKVLQSL